MSDSPYIVLNWRGHVRALAEYPTADPDDYLYEFIGEVAEVDGEDKEVCIGKFRRRQGRWRAGDARPPGANVGIPTVATIRAETG
jgi:hypothetical protein